MFNIYDSILNFSGKRFGLALLLVVMDAEPAWRPCRIRIHNTGKLMFCGAVNSKDSQQVGLVYLFLCATVQLVLTLDKGSGGGTDRHPAQDGDTLRYGGQVVEQITSPLNLSATKYQK
jgi:hypothetical protein